MPSGGTVLKRSGPPKRTKGLHVNPETVRAFLQRSRGQLRRTPMPRHRKTPQRPAVGVLSTTEYRKAVLHLDGYRSTLSGLPVSYGRASLHHVIQKQELRRRGLHHLLTDPRGSITLTGREHERHTLRVEVVPYENLPQRARDFAHELGPWAEERLLREHPPLGNSGPRREEDEDGA